MKINKIVLYNFNSYEGFNEFDFTSESSDKNIILIGGKNGAGKTSLFSAIKIALYGPLAFGYVGINPHYIAKIKESINSKAFQKDIVEAKVQIIISLLVGREVKEYEITRAWDYTRQKLEEKYYVKLGEKLLDAQELSYFQNYLQSLISPDLFELFLFDGEEVGNIFSTGSYNSYVKNAIYMMCGLDTFEIIRKYAYGYAGKVSRGDDGEIQGYYEKLREKENLLENEMSQVKSQIMVTQESINQLETELANIETAFKNAGGITKTERQKLEKEFGDAERIKTEVATKIKLFVEGLMPFFIVKDFAGKITTQLDYEEKGEIYYYVQQKLKKNELASLLGKKSDINDETVDMLMRFLLAKFKPKGFKKNVPPLHGLSKEDIGRVNSVISSLEDFNTEGMVDLIGRRKAAADRTAEINRIFKNSMADEDMQIYAAKENELLKNKDELLKVLYEKQEKEKQLAWELSNVIQQKNKALQNLKDNAQNGHIYELSSGLSQMMNEILSNKRNSIKRKLETLLTEKLSRIYRKDNLITHIEIEDDFQFNLYQDAKYSTTELNHLIHNVGGEVFLWEIGKVGKRKLFETYNVDSVGQLQQVLSNVTEEREIDLYKRIDINRLSKGERQIFILLLYWAIIELSGQDIPFIIDTPYGRIDAGHRRVISEKFFPHISKQVIILSTDEEVNEEYYKVIKPHIAKEFLLLNDENQNKTFIEQHYFFEV